MNYKFPDLSPDSTSPKIQKKSLIDNINKLYENEYLNNNDSVMIIVNESITETVQKAIDDFNIELQNQLDEEAKKSTPDGTFIVSDLMLYNTNAVKDKLKQFKF